MHKAEGMSTSLLVAFGLFFNRTQTFRRCILEMIICHSATDDGSYGTSQTCLRTVQCLQIWLGVRNRQRAAARGSSMKVGLLQCYSSYCTTGKYRACLFP